MSVQEPRVKLRNSPGAPAALSSSSSETSTNISSSANRVASVIVFVPVAWPGPPISPIGCYFSKPLLVNGWVNIAFGSAFRSMQSLEYPA